MRAYQINEFDWYAADSYDEAVRLACKDVGMCRDLIVDPMYSNGEPEPDSNTVLDNSRNTQMTVKACADGMAAPGWAFGIEY